MTNKDAEKKESPNMEEIRVMKPFINGRFIDSESGKFNMIYDPSTGREIAKVPCCTQAEVEQACARPKTESAGARLPAMWERRWK